MEDINRIKPYIAHLDRQLQELKPLLETHNAKSLDEQLLLLHDERQRLDLTNKYAYMLSSLMFAYMKVLNYKDMSPVMGELARVKRYMDSVKKLDSGEEQKEQNKLEEQNHAKQVLNKALAPSISQSNFKGKHTKFESNDDKDPSSEDVSNDINKEDEIKEVGSSSSTKKKNLPGRTKGKSEASKSNMKDKSNTSTKTPNSSSSAKISSKSNKVTKPSSSSKSKGRGGKSGR